MTLLLIIVDWEWELSGDDEVNNGEAEEELFKSLNGCEEKTVQENGDDDIERKLAMKERQIENGDPFEDEESLYADSEFAVAIAKAAETSASSRSKTSKLKSSEISTVNQDVGLKGKRGEGVIRASLKPYNNSPVGRLAPIQDHIQVRERVVIYDKSYLILKKKDT